LDWNFETASSGIIGSLSMDISLGVDLSAFSNESYFDAFFVGLKALFTLGANFEC